MNNECVLLKVYVTSLNPLASKSGGEGRVAGTSYFISLLPPDKNYFTVCPNHQIQNSASFTL